MDIMRLLADRYIFMKVCMIGIKKGLQIKEKQAGFWNNLLPTFVAVDLS